jgi:polyisoprenoid-binding protein YceI
MKHKYLSLLVFTGVCLSSIGMRAQASTWKIDPGNSAVSFQVRHLGVSTVRGTISGVKGMLELDEKDITKSTVNATVDAATVTTGNESRDMHLKSDEFFGAAKHPELVFKSTSLTNAGGKLRLIGDLTMAGVTKSITLDLDGPSAPVTDAKGITRSGCSATGMLSRKEFNFGQSSPLNVAIGDEIKFTIDVEIDKE